MCIVPIYHASMQLSRCIARARVLLTILVSLLVVFQLALHPLIFRAARKGSWDKDAHQEQFRRHWCKVQEQRTDWFGLLAPCQGQLAWRSRRARSSNRTDAKNSFVSFWDLKPAGWQNLTGFTYINNNKYILKSNSKFKDSFMALCIIRCLLTRKLRSLSICPVWPVSQSILISQNCFWSELPFSWIRAVQFSRSATFNDNINSDLSIITKHSISLGLLVFRCKYCSFQAPIYYQFKFNDYINSNLSFVIEIVLLTS